MNTVWVLTALITFDGMTIEEPLEGFKYPTVCDQQLTTLPTMEGVSYECIGSLPTVSISTPSYMR